MQSNPEQPVLEPLFPRPYMADELPAKAVHGLVEASEEERARIAAVLDLAGLAMLRMKFQLACAGQRNFKLSGRVLASVTQTCVVTLQPVKTSIDEKIEIEFWPPEDVLRIEAEGTPESMCVPLEGPEPILDGIIDVGQLAYEHLAALLDPYPKLEGAKFEWNNPDLEQGNVSADRPFAGLARLKEAPESNSNSS